MYITVASGTCVTLLYPDIIIRIIVHLSTLGFEGMEEKQTDTKKDLRGDPGIESICEVGASMRGVGSDDNN